MSSLIHTIILHIETSKYALLFLGTLIEGPIVTMTGGFLFKLGLFHFWQMYLVLALGDFTADLGWYLLGRYGTRKLILKFGHWFALTPDMIEKGGKLFHKYHQKILIINKLTAGFGLSVVVLLVAGISKVPFKNYFIYNLVGELIWTGMLIMIGYFVGNIYAALTGPIKILLIASILTLFFSGLKYLHTYIKKHDFANI